MGKRRVGVVGLVVEAVRISEGEQDRVPRLEGGGGVSAFVCRERCDALLVRLRSHGRADGSIQRIRIDDRRCGDGMAGGINVSAPMGATSQ